VSYLLNGVSDEQVQGLERGLREARAALESGRAVEARRLYGEMVSDDNLAVLAGLRQEAEYGFALATEACGDLGEAILILRRLRDTAGESVAPERRIAVAIALSRCHRELGDPGTAIEVAERAMAEMGGQGWSDDLIELGATLLAGYFERGDMLRAEQYTAELLSAADALGTPRAIVAANWNAAVNFDVAGRGEEALPLAERAMAIQSETGEPRNLARLRTEYAYIRLRNRPGEADACRDLLLRAEQELKESSASTVDLAHCLLYLGHAEISLGRIDQAVEYTLRCIDVLGDSSPDGQAEAHLLLCREYLQLGRPQDAAPEVKAAMELLETLPATRFHTENWLMAAAVLEELDDQEGSRRAYQRAMESGGV
jgi:tetratricopeptide (TPR) repeat protein